MRCIKLGSMIGCWRVPQVHFIQKHFAQKQTMCKSVNMSHLTVCLLTARKLCSATLTSDFNSDLRLKVDGI